MIFSANWADILPALWALTLIRKDKTGFKRGFYSRDQGLIRVDFTFHY
jgi:hypothetical protein